MEKYYSPFLRLQLYLTFFANIDGNVDPEIENGYTLNLLNKNFQIPLTVMRNDIASIVCNGNTLGFEPDEDDEQYIKLQKKFKTEFNWFDENKYNLKQLKSVIQKGHFDNIPIIYDKSNDDTVDIPLTALEYKAFMEWQQQSDDKNFKLSFSIKDSYRFKKASVAGEVFSCICDALERNKSLYIRYNNMKGKGEEIKLKPLKMLYDANDNEYVILSIVKHEIKAIRLEYIKEVRLIPEKIDIPEKDMQLLEKLPCVWGLDFSKQPEYVKVKFYNVGNVWEKVKRELSYRTKGKIYECDGFLYYEDYVSGREAFRSWIYGLGSAAIVEEPAGLREEILASLNARNKK